jgi:hypothetical protein
LIDLSVWGASELEPHRRIDLSFIPCKPDRNVKCKIPEGSLSQTWDSESFAKKLEEIKEYIG